MGSFRNGFYIENLVFFSMGSVVIDYVHKIMFLDVLGAGNQLPLFVLEKNCIIRNIINWIKKQAVPKSHTCPAHER